MSLVLPIDAHIPRAKELLAGHGGLVVVAPPGSGKTTRLAPALIDSVAGKVLLLQPRRVAARLSARRIAQEWGERPGQTIGFRVRHERCVGPETRLEVLTEGMLTRWLLSDPFLEGVDAVVLDEFHERSLDADLCLAMLRELQLDARPELRIVVMSATMDPGPVAAFLGDAPVLRTSGRAFPVEIEHRADHGYIEERVAKAVRSLGRLAGHCLVFLPGKGEIRRCQQALAELEHPVLPLHGGLKPQEQERALAQSHTPKVVLSTNIAETSVTLPGVRYVIDTGLSRVPVHDPSLGITRLELGPISQASADQRAGRAGRTGSGQVIRLWSKSLTLRPEQQPELLRADLSSALLAVMEWGAKPQSFGWFQVPPSALVDRAMGTLELLGAQREGGLSAVGHTLARLPVHPRLGRVVMAGHARGCLWAAAAAAALASERDPWSDGSFPGAHQDDLHARVQALAQGQPGHRRALRELRAVVEQLQRVARAELGRGGGAARSVPSPRVLVQCLMSGFGDRVAQRRSPGSRRFRLASGQGAQLETSSLVEDASLILAVGLDAACKGERSEHWIRIASPVQAEDLTLVEHRALRWEGERVVCEVQQRVGVLVIRSERALADPTQIAQALAERALKDPAKVLHHSPELERLLARLELVRAHCPEQGLPELDPLLLLPELCVGRSSLRQLRALDWPQELLGRLSWSQRKALDRCAPERLRVSSGCQVRVEYSRGAVPVLAARIQQLFGMQTPHICGGKLALRVHLLAPNGRPQQVTDDLSGFWTGSYAEVRKALRGRYPKHNWPEKPGVEHAQDRPRRRRR